LNQWQKLNQPPEVILNHNPESERIRNSNSHAGGLKSARGPSGASAPEEGAAASCSGGGGGDVQKAPKAFLKRKTRSVLVLNGPAKWDHVTSKVDAKFKVRYSDTHMYGSSTHIIYWSSKR
jgi:hypothetical protein